MIGCNGQCQQGRRLCPTPQACEISEQEEMPRLARTIFRVAAAFLVVFALLALIP